MEAQQNTYTTEQAATYLGLEQSHIRRLCRDGKMAHTKIGTGRHAIYLMTRDALDAYKQENHKPGWQKGRKRKSTEEAEE